MKFFIRGDVGDVMKKIAKDLVVSLVYQVRTEDDVLVDEPLVVRHLIIYMVVVL